MKSQRNVRGTVADPIQQRGLEDQVFHKPCGNPEIIVRLAELPFRLQNRGGRQVALFKPCIANGCNRGVEIMIAIVKSMECKNIPARNFSSAQHAVADRHKRVDFIQPPHRDTLARHEVVESGNHDGGGTRGAGAVTESMEPAKRGGLPAKPVT